MLCVLVLVRVIAVSMLFAAPMQIGVMFAIWVMATGRFFGLSIRWDRSVSRYLRILLPVLAIIGVVVIIYGVSGSMPATSPIGKSLRHLNAYLEDGKCYAVFNRDKAVEMPIDFCDNFNLHFSAVFCGSWLFVSALLYWASLARRTLELK